MIALPSPHEELEVAAPGGRTLAVARWGSPGGIPVISHHGTPMSRLDMAGSAELLEELGVELIMFDRPGYGRSPALPERTVASAAEDAAAVADGLGIGRFRVHGVSGGGPHALACAALLGERVIRAACVVGVAPFDLPGFDPLMDLNELSVEEFRVALRGREALEAYVAEFVEQTGEEGAAVMDAWMDELPEPDRDAVGSPAGRAMLQRALTEAMEQGGAGWVDDDLAFVAPWGFDLAAIRSPVSVWAGALDRLVPVAHARAMAGRIPGAELHVVPDRGHELDHEPIYRWLSEE